MTERKWRLTASRFGEICKATNRRNKTKLCASIYSQLPLKSPAVIHGQQYEGVALKKFESVYDLEVSPVGFFIDRFNNFLGATPDGVISDEAIVEVKCPYKHRNSEISESIVFLEKNTDGDLTLKKDHKYYYQVQGQLNICQRNVCYFVVYTFKDIFVEKIYVDKKLWEICMVPKLELFYKKYYRNFVASHLC